MQAGLRLHCAAVGFPPSSPSRRLREPTGVLGPRRPLRGRRAIAASAASTTVFLGLLAALFFLAPGSVQVRRTFSNLPDARTVLLEYPQQGIFSIGSAFALNSEMFLVAEVLLLILAMVIAVIRQLQGPVLFPLRMLAIAYTDFFRGVPLILVIYAIGFGVPALNLAGVSTQPTVLYGLVALMFAYSTYVSKVYRAGSSPTPCQGMRICGPGA